MAATVEQCYPRSKSHGITLKQQSAVARSTVSKWRLYDPAFQAALQARRADVSGSSLDQLRSTPLRP